MAVLLFAALAWLYRVLLHSSWLEQFLDDLYHKKNVSEIEAQAEAARKEAEAKLVEHRREVKQRTLEAERLRKLTDSFPSEPIDED